ncbi:conserved hypothetical protein [Geminocystis sp. NIES-3708]|uniref:DUF4382 domain-containing protein n=1 Tax=Geminocystis sp. NIES-3708 TaxID=1615909 RepID=UPI0005FCAF52|nr:DUF4382 domain-containing protein [Geminocystis sp. NIES-3708]BAQ61458.1 conserved hypothetical protein [Geminocystis sp. NIES-3708]
MSIVKKFPSIPIRNIIIAIILSSCSTKNEVDTTESNPQNQISQGETLTLVANGEDFIRQGFVSKDGWRIDFNHAYVTLADTIAYQTNPSFNAEKEKEIKPIESVTLINTATTIDLAQGDENAPPIKVAQANAPVGNYNAVSWKLVNNPENTGSIILDGTAVKDNKIIKFLISLPVNLEYSCGEFVGDERKGILEAGKTAEIETTFHFDHLFGDAQTPPDDDLNMGALGFQSLATLAQNGELKTNLATLEKTLNPEDYQKLMNNLNSLGHVGEGHCRLNS